MDTLDIIIPIFNESASIEALVKRINRAFIGTNIDWGIIFVDDNSTDNSVEVINGLISEYLRPVKTNKKVIYDSDQKNSIKEELFRIKLLTKRGKKGKAYSILEGSRRSKAEFVAMIDGDLQYPPEALPKMYEIAKKSGICIAERKDNNTSALRRVLTKLNKKLVEKLILGFDFDVQSGLKVFRKEIIDQLNETVVTPWSLDMHVINTSKDLGYEVKVHDIKFSERVNGVSKVNIIKTSFDIILSALRLRFSKDKVYRIPPQKRGNALGTGFLYNGKKFITHTLLTREKSALETFSVGQKYFILITFLALALSLFINLKLTAIIIISLLSIMYFIDFVFSLYLLSKSMGKPPEISFSNNDIKNIKESDLPVYSILCPLYKESKVLPQFVKNISELEWPKDKLDVLLLLEEDDQETIRTAEQQNLPEYFRILVVPHSKPKTKPKACNYGLNFVKGKYVVIYDAEDKPDPLQLKKAYLGFTKSDNNVACLQSKLNYYNSKQNILTRLFTAEYSLWFDLILPGFQLINTVIPLGGTSNHFKVKTLKFLDGWDAFNVTEDCDLGARLFKEGFNTAIIDSTT